MFLFDHNEIVERLHKYPIFNSFSVDLLKNLIQHSEIIEVPAGTVLFQIHEPSDYVYYIIDGYVELYSSSIFDKKIASVRSGGLVGETSVLAGEPHGFSAKTNKISQLIKMDKNTFLAFFEKDPKALMQLTENVARRLRRMVMGFAEDRYPFKNIVLLNTTPSIKLEKFKRYFEQCKQQDKTYLYDKKTFEESQLDIVPFLFQCESKPGINIFFVDMSEDVWSKTVLLHAEYIYFITQDDTWNSLPLDLIDGENSRPCDLIICHKSSETPYTYTHKFYEKHAFKRHHHFKDKPHDYERLYRFMTGQAIGLVISAGGFRGYAHYGLIKALLESRIPIDYIGGCSFGAAIGAGLAENFDWESFKSIYERSIVKIKKQKFYHFTFPFTSILSGKLPTHLLQEVYADRCIEDLPINFFCVTGNLSIRQKEVKTQGKIWEWLRASISLPGIFPPLEKNGNIYVDGAVCTSLPVQDMREFLDGAGKIISLDVRLPLLLKDKHKYAFPPILSFKDILAYKLRLTKNRYILPNILDILLEASSIDQHMADNMAAKKSDILIAADTSSLSFSNPSIGDPESLIAYTFAKEKLKEHQAMFSRWISK